MKRVSIINGWNAIIIFMILLSLRKAETVEWWNKSIFRVCMCILWEIDVLPSGGRIKKKNSNSSWASYMNIDKIYTRSEEVALWFISYTSNLIWLPSCVFAKGVDFSILHCTWKRFITGEKEKRKKCDFTYVTS